MRLFFSEGYHVPLPANHRFPMGKYPALRDAMLQSAVCRASDIHEPTAADWSLLARVHTREYLHSLEHGTLSPMAVRRLGLPWSDALVRRARLAAMGTLLAARAALSDGVAGNLAGGTHHAFADRGEGFCVINDAAIAIRALQAENAIRRALVVDLDVHQGNGTAAIFRDDPHVHTFSMHGQKNYPFVKVPSTLDVGLPDGAGDDEYLAALAQHLPAAIAAAKPQLAVYLAGVDVVQGDRFGRLALTHDGLIARERFVFSTLSGAGVPTAIVLAGGYAASAQKTALLHLETFRAAKAIYD